MSGCLKVSKDSKGESRSEAINRQTDGHLKAELSSQRELVSRLHAELATGKDSIVKAQILFESCFTSNRRDQYGSCMIQEGLCGGFLC